MLEQLPKSLAAELQRRIKAILAGNSEPQELQRQIETLLRASEPLFAAGLTDAILGGWVSGAHSVADTLPAGVSYQSGKLPPVPPKPPSAAALLYPGDDDEPLVSLAGIENAVEALATRQVLLPDDFYRIGAAARQQAFTITADLTQATIEKVRDLLRENVEQGPSLRGFSEALQEALPGLPIGESHLEQVYRNNVQEAYAQGIDKILNHPMVDDHFPFRRYTAIHDARARPEHRAMETLGLEGGPIYWRDDPTWLRFRPPWDFGCRCGFIPLTVRMAADFGLKLAQEWLASGVEPPRQFVQPPPFSPSAGWERGALVA